MEIGQLRAFVVAAREKSFTRAAEALYVTQPSVTARIQTLEVEMKTPLFLRKGRTIELTDSGKAFLPYAERALSVLDEGEQAVRNVRDGTAGRLALAAIQTICLFLIAPVLDEYHRTNPNVEISLRQGVSTEIIEMLLDDVVQMGVLLGPVIHPQLKTIASYQDDFIVVASPQHHLAQRRGPEGPLAVTPDELSTEEFIMHRWGTAFDTFMSRVSDLARKPRINMEIEVTETTKAMVKMNAGLAALPRFAVLNDLHSGALVEIPIKDWEPVIIQVVMVHRRDREMSLPAQRFAELWQALNPLPV
ncbi:MAG TPA: LysR family transcriptional regulator [Chloroflexia bacterium]|nr:LysR family transcriptional regulator [Chloroflexia bacterium]